MRIDRDRENLSSTAREATGPEPASLNKDIDNTMVQSRHLDSRLVLTSQGDHANKKQFRDTE